MRYQIRHILAEQLGCAMTDEGLVKTDDDGRTTVPGVYAAGDLARRTQQLIFAAAVVTRAAFAISADAFLAADAS